MGEDGLTQKSHEFLVSEGTSLGRKWLRRGRVWILGPETLEKLFHP
jgi:hypothetical protein